MCAAREGGEHDQGGVTGEVQQGVGAPRSCSKAPSPETEAEPLWLQVPAWATSGEQPTPGGGGPALRTGRGWSDAGPMIAGPVSAAPKAPSVVPVVECVVSLA